MKKLYMMPHIQRVTLSTDDNILLGIDDSPAVGSGVDVHRREEFYDNPSQDGKDKDSDGWKIGLW